jgi:type VI secretion system secreted protein Hcp
LAGIPDFPGGAAPFFYIAVERSDKMAFDAFVKIDEIEGESRDEGHCGWIEVIRFAFALRQKISGSPGSAGGASAGRADFRDFIFKKELDHASPQLALACAAGTHIDEIRLALFRAGGEKVKFMEYKLQNCLISRIQAFGASRFPTESVRINFGKIHWQYVLQQRAGGGPCGQVSTGWDLQRNRKM